MPELDQASINLLRDMAAWWKSNKSNLNQPQRSRPRNMAAKVMPKLWMIGSYVTTDADGNPNDYNGYYRCSEIIFDATLFNRGNSVPYYQQNYDYSDVVLNLTEVGCAVSRSIPSGYNLLWGWKMLDDEGNAINVGFPLMPSVMLAYVASDQTGMTGAYYNCKIKGLAEQAWNVSGGMTSYTNSDVVVYNLYEMSNEDRQLQYGDYMIAFPHLPYLGFSTTYGHGMRYVGFPILGGRLSSLDITGSRSGGAALTNLLTFLSNSRMIINNTTA